MVRRRNAVSELMAIVIVIAIVLSVGAFIFAWVTGLIKTGSVEHEAQITFARLSWTAGSGWYLTVVIKNTGTVSISDSRITSTIGSIFWDNTLGGWRWRGEGRISGGLTPGQSNSHSWQVRYVTIGRTYSFRIRVWFTDGAYKEYLINVRAEQG
jgi:hypothetical protein